MSLDLWQLFLLFGALQGLLLALGLLLFPRSDPVPGRLLAALLLSAASFSMLLYFYLGYDFLERYEHSVIKQFASATLPTVTLLKRLAVAFSLFMTAFYIAWGELLYYAGAQEEFSRLLMALPACSGFLAAVCALRRPELLSDCPNAGLPGPEDLAESAARPAVAAEDAQERLAKLRAFMETREPWRDGELRLADLAAAS